MRSQLKPDSRAFGGPFNPSVFPHSEVVAPLYVAGVVAKGRIKVGPSSPKDESLQTAIQRDSSFREIDCAQNLEFVQSMIHGGFFGLNSNS